MTTATKQASYNKHPVTTRIGTMVKARAPLIAVLSAEEHRVYEHIRHIALEQEKALFVWTLTHGLRRVDPWANEESEPIEHTQGPDGALDHIFREMAPDPDNDSPDWQNCGEPALIVMKDLHSFISGSQAEPLVIRGLRDLASGLVNRRQTVILLSPALDLPPELEKDVFVIDFPLPGPEEIDRQVEGFITDLRARIERTHERIAVDLDGDRDKLIQALCGLTDTEITSVLLQAVLELRGISLTAIPLIIREKQAIINKCPALELYQDTGDFGDVGGLDLLKAWGEMAALSYTATARQFGIRPPRSMLLVGVPGCGKSLSAKALAGTMRVPLVRLDFGAVFGSLLGESETTARAALKIVEALGPCVFWWDEVEKGLPSGQGTLDDGTSKRVFSTFLTWMQETTAQALIVATANNVASLPPEFYRRFTESMFVDLPEATPRRQIFTIHLEKRGRDPDKFDLNLLAGETGGFTGDEIEQAIEEALRQAFRASDPDITTEHIMAVIRTTVPLSQSMKEPIARMRKWAERARPASSHQQSGGARAQSRLDAIVEL